MARQLGASVAVNLQAMPLTVIKTMPTPVKEKRVHYFFLQHYSAMSNCISYRAHRYKWSPSSAKAYYGLTLSIINCNGSGSKTGYCITITSSDSKDFSLALFKIVSHTYHE